MIQREGPGWRLAWDPARRRYPVLIGGEGWAFELTGDEWRELVSLITALVEQHRALVDQLMAEEALSLELERLPWWGCLDGDRGQWDLRVVLQGDTLGERGVEGHWPAPAAQAMAAAVRTLWDSPPS